MVEPCLTLRTSLVRLVALVMHCRTPYEGIETDLQTFFPARLTSVTPVDYGPTPYTLATMSEPAGEPIFGVTEARIAVKEIP